MIEINYSKQNSFVCFWCDSPHWARASSFTRFLDHTERRTTVGRTPLEEWSARRRDLYLTTHNTHNRQTSMPPPGFEPVISVGERPQTHRVLHDNKDIGTDISVLTQGIVTNDSPAYSNRCADYETGWTNDKRLDPCRRYRLPCRTKSEDRLKAHFTQGCRVFFHNGFTGLSVKLTAHFYHMLRSTNTRLLRILDRCTLIWFEIRINYQLDAIEYFFTLARHVSGLHAHLQQQWML